MAIEELPQSSESHPTAEQKAGDKPIAAATIESDSSSSLRAAVSSEIFGPRSPFAQQKESAKA
ncbi:MAG: hypothetical protein K2X81_29030, partial [Candidatus Obscuribacterales bacterium]|nr:hypothetical protein [Candidatus Obscuribacterales bacterium]